MSRREFGARPLRVRPQPCEEGMITTFVVGVVFSLILAAGLVFDGGSVLAARRSADNRAATAARVGAQAVDVDELYRTGVVHIEVAEATAAARAAASGTGVVRVEVHVTAVDVSVVVVMEHELAMLGVGGLVGPVEVSGRATARLASGVGGTS